MAAIENFNVLQTFLWLVLDPINVVATDINMGFLNQIDIISSPYDVVPWRSYDVPVYDVIRHRKWICCFIMTTLAVHNNTRPYHVLDHFSIIFIILILILVTQHLIERVAAWLHLALPTSRSAWQTIGRARAALSTTSGSAVTVNYLKQRVWCGIHFIHHWDELICLSFPPLVCRLQIYLFSHPCHNLEVRPELVVLSGLVCWWQTLWCYKWHSR